jgi:predicted nucleic acid-binding Zn ribbon protein
MTAATDAVLQPLLAHCWAAVAGPDIGAVTLVSHFADGVLTVLTPSAAWVARLEPQSAELREKLNHALLAPDLVTAIRWARGIPAEKKP